MPGSRKFAVLAGAAALALIAAGSCGDDEQPRLCIGDESVIVALSLESAWIYRVTDYDTLDNVIRTRTDTVTIVGESVIDGQPWFVTSLDDEVWANREDGFWIWQDYDSDFTEPYLLIKYPAVAMEDYPIPVEEIHFDTMNVADTDADVSVPYGTFHAVTYRLADYLDSTLSLGYYVPGIGKVREFLIVDRETRSVRRVLELLSFTTAGC